MKLLALLVVVSLVACSGGQARRDVTAASESGRPSFGGESAGQDVGRLTLDMALQGLANQGCSDVEVLGSEEVARPGGFVVVFVAQLCEGFEDAGRVAMVASAIGSEFVLSNTLHVLPGIGGSPTDRIGVLELAVHEVHRGGSSVVLLRYRSPSESEAARDWVERAVVGTFSVDALDLAVVQPLRFDLRAGGGRIRGEGSLSFEDTDGDGNLDLRMELSAEGQGCRRDPCRRGSHRCEATVPWQRGGYDVVLEGEACLYLGRLEL